MYDCVDVILELLRLCCHGISYVSSFNGFCFNLNRDKRFFVGTIRSFVDLNLIPYIGQTTCWSKMIMLKIRFFFGEL